jgi:SAM-dependent methyltransferase
VLGGLFCALIAPLIFDWTYEHLLLLVAAAWLMRSQSPFERIAKLWTGGALARGLTIGGIIAVVLLAIAGKGAFGAPGSSQVNHLALVAVLFVAILGIGNRVLFTASVAALLIAAGGWEKLELSASPGKMTRSFFGIYAVRPGAHNSRMLVHGTTLHGIQNLGSLGRERMETTYYAPRSGVGLAMQGVPALFGPEARIAVVGLGTGTLACYARPGQTWTFYEIDPAVVRIARDPGRFTFLSGCKPDARIEIGDARLLIEHELPAAADVLVVDAFSSDSVPMHLLTSEAFADYRRLLSPNGLLLLHISNRYIDLKPVVAAAAATGGWHAGVRRYRPDDAGTARNETGSNWIALSRSPATLGRMIAGSREQWDPLPQRPGFAPWTDDHASVLPLISFFGT